LISHGFQEDGYGAHVSQGLDGFVVVVGMGPEEGAALLLEGGVGGEAAHGLEAHFGVEAVGAVGFEHLLVDQFSGDRRVRIVVGIVGGGAAEIGIVGG